MKKNNNDVAGKVGIKKDQISHVLERPSMYVGDTAVSKKYITVFSEEEGKLKYKAVTWPNACFKLFAEIIANASDNIIRTREYNSKLKRNELAVPLGKIKVTMDSTKISVENQGLPINTKYLEEYKVYNPDLIFGEFLSGTNYEDERTGAGQNGIGAKATNIFSKKFVVKIENQPQGTIYEQTWTENMRKKNPEPEIIKNQVLKESRTTVTYWFDFDKVPSLGNIKKYPEEVFEIYKGYCASIANACKVPIIFNKTTFDFKNIVDYCSLFYNNINDIKHNSILPFNYITYYAWPNKTDVMNHKNLSQTSKDGNTMPDIEAIVIDEMEESEKEEKIEKIKDSYVNGIPTIHGGIHYDGFSNVIRKKIADTYNLMMTKTTKKDQSKEKDSTTLITITNVSKLIKIIIFINNVVNPEFDSQTKTKLTGIGGKSRSVFKFEDINIEFTEILSNDPSSTNTWNLKKQLDKIFYSKNGRQKNDKRFSSLKVTNANHAGKAQSSKCVLYIVEGTSASAYIQKIINITENGKDFLGYMEIQGKILNQTNAGDSKKSENNKVIQLIEKTLGISRYMDFTVPETLKNLRYGKVCILSDQDVDGNHIKALLIDLFKERYKFLLESVPDFLEYRPTPLIRIMNNSEDHLFYSQDAFEQFKKSHKNINLNRVKYYKGLGSSSDVEVEQDFYINYTIKLINDQEADNTLKKAFATKFANERKQQLKNYKPSNVIIGPNEQLVVPSAKELKEKNESKFKRKPIVEEMTITNYIKNELIKFSFDNLRRSIPMYKDGLKDSERKIIYGLILIFKIDRLNKKYVQQKIPSVGASILEKLKYHHGPDIINKVIVGLCQDFKGTNNLPVAKIVGMQGNASKGPSSCAAPRYISVKPRKLFSYIYRDEDSILYDFREDEGAKIEPVNFFPVIPLHLINGVRGIATGFSTFIPSYNPNDIINWLKLRIENELNGIDDDNVDWEKFPDLNPWFNKFYGNVSISTKSKTSKTKTALEITENLNDLKNSRTSTPESENEEDDNSEREPTLEDFSNMNVEGKLSCVTTGLFKFVTVEKTKETVLVIYEYPIGTWDGKYSVEVLDKLIDKEYITDYDAGTLKKGMINTYILKGLSEEILKANSEELHTILKLKNKFGISNIYLIDENSRPRSYENIVDTINYFYEWRKGMYNLRKKLYIKLMKEEIKDIEMKIKFYRLVITNVIEIKNVSEEYISRELQKHGIDEEIYKKAFIRQISKESIEKMNTHLEEKRIILNEYSSKHYLQIWYDELLEIEEVYNAKRERKIKNGNLLTHKDFNLTVQKYLNDIKTGKQTFTKVEKKKSKKVKKIE